MGGGAGVAKRKHPTVEHDNYFFEEGTNPKNDGDWTFALSYKEARISNSSVIGIYPFPKNRIEMFQDQIALINVENGPLKIVKEALLGISPTSKATDL